MTKKHLTERRASTLEVEVRAVDDDPEKPQIAGYAAVYNELSEDIGGFRERIAPGAFTKAMTGDVRALFNHDPSQVLGRTKARTLRLSEDQKGLSVEIDPPNTAAARTVVEAIRRGDVSQMSFGFRTRKDQWDMIDGEAIRTLIEVELFDVSVVTFPAYPQTDAGLRSLEEFRKTIAEVRPEAMTAARRMHMLARQASV